MKSKVTIIILRNILFILVLMISNLNVSTSTLVNEFVHIKVHIPAEIEPPNHVIHVSKTSPKVIHHFHRRHPGPSKKNPLAKHAGLLEDILRSEIKEPLSNDHYKYLHNVRQIAHHIGKFAVKPQKVKYHAESYAAEAEEATPEDDFDLRSQLHDDYDIDVVEDTTPKDQSKGLTGTYEELTEETTPNDIVELPPTQHHGYGDSYSYKPHGLDIAGPKKVVNTYEIVRKKVHNHHHHVYGDKANKHRPKGHGDTYKSIDDIFDDYHTNLKDSVMKPKTRLQTFKVIQIPEVEYENNHAHRKQQSSVYNGEKDFTTMPVRNHVTDGYDYIRQTSATKVPYHYMKEYNNRYGDQAVATSTSRRPPDPSVYNNKYRNNYHNPESRPEIDKAVSQYDNYSEKYNQNSLSSGYKTIPDEDVPDEPVENTYQTDRQLLNDFHSRTFPSSSHRQQHYQQHQPDVIKPDVRTQTESLISPALRLSRVGLQQSSAAHKFYGSPHVHEDMRTSGYQYSPPYL